MSTATDETLGLAGHLDLADALSSFRPRDALCCLEWAIRYAQTDYGRPYDHAAYPHAGAPGGPCDAVDDPIVRVIALQWSSRVGKTYFGQVMQQYKADVDPGPMMFVSASEKLATEIVSRLYLQLEQNQRLKGQLRGPKFRKRDRVDLADCRIWVAWARSVSTLADKQCQWGHANEISKWEHLSTSREADPLQLFLDRGKDFPGRKFLLESTPTVTGKCRIERAYNQSTACLYFVPCPRCKKYQVLDLGRSDTEYGIKFQLNEAGRGDPELAQNTARYQCLECKGFTEEHERHWMMRRGVWVPQGCEVVDARALDITEAAMAGERRRWQGWSEAPWVRGKPDRDGTVAGYKVSSLYALSLSWGDIASQFLRVKDKPQDFRNFVNQWLGNTWSYVAHKQTWQQLGERCITLTPRQIVPEWASLITVGVDRQQSMYPYVVEAWGPGRRSATIEYGEAGDLGEISQHVLERDYQVADGGMPLRPALTLLDSGFRPEGIYDFCAKAVKRGLAAYPSKGSNKALTSDYLIATLGENTSMPGMKLVHVDTIRTQGWIERQMHTLAAGDPGGYSLYAASVWDHQDFLEQLLNDAPVDDLDSNNNATERWERIDTNVPNDFRDARRYAYVAMLLATRGTEIKERVPEPVEKRKNAVISTGRTRADGRPWNQR